MAPKQRRSAMEDDSASSKTLSTGLATKKRRTSKNQSQVPDPSLWRKSNVAIGNSITQTQAREQYRLLPRELKGLEYSLYEISSLRDAHLYNEREVERKAWEKYGGPEGFESLLIERHNIWLKSERKQPFKQPFAYARNASGEYVAILSGPLERGEDPYTPNQALRQLKRTFPAPWIWTSCNKTLDTHSYHGDETTLCVSPYARSSDREDALQTALSQLGPYPPRPKAPLPSSESVDQLRSVLDNVPCLPKSQTLDDPRLDYNFDGCDGEEWYDWGALYLTELFDALNMVIDEHGLGDDGWKTARWEVYDKYADAMSGISCYFEQRQGNKWTDKAHEWLQGRFKDDTFVYKCSGRQKYSSGRRYNDNLLEAQEY